MITRILLLLSFVVSALHPDAVHAALGGRVALYSDPGLSECRLTDASAGVADVYVVHRLAGSEAAADQVVGVLFALTPSPGFNGTWLEDIVPAGMTGVGSSPSGIAAGYGGSCRFDDLLVLRVRYQVQGTSSLCSFVEAVPYPGFPTIITTTCGVGDQLPVDGSRLVVNGDETCSCDEVVASKSSTWGRIKAMYRN